MRNRISAYLLLLLAVVFFWGITWPLMKTGLDYTPPIWFGAMRMIVGALGMFALLMVRGQMILPPRADRYVLLSIAILQMAAPTALMHFSLVYVEAGRASLLAYTHPLWVAPVAILILKEPFTRSIAQGLFLGLLGLIVLFNPTGFDWSNRSVLIGNGLLILSAMCWAIGILHVRAHHWTVSALELSPWAMLISALTLGLLALAREDISQIAPNIKFAGILAFIGLVATAFCYWGAVVATQRLPAMVSSLGFLGVPVVGILSSILLLRETVTLSLIIGLLLISAGIGVLIIGESRWAMATPPKKQ